MRQIYYLQIPPTRLLINIITADREYHSIISNPINQLCQPLQRQQLALITSLSSTKNHIVSAINQTVRNFFLNEREKHVCVRVARSTERKLASSLPSSSGCPVFLAPAGYDYTYLRARSRLLKQQLTLFSK